MNNYMKIALKEAIKAYKNQDVPVGAVIVNNGKIISKAHNQKNSKSIATRHAEIIAIEKACKKLKTWHLEDCEIYITMEPCTMCFGAIEESRIKKIIYAIDNKNYGYISKKKNLSKYNINKIESFESLDLLHSFFDKKRK